MGAIENITGRIKSDASKKAKSKIDEAKSQAQEILRNAKKELDKEKSAMESECAKTIKIQKSRAISEGKLEARKMMLNAKEEVIKNAFDLAFERLKNLDAANKEKFLGEAIRTSVAELGSDVIALCHPQDVALVTRIAQAAVPGITVSSESFNYIGGVIVRAKDASAQINVSFEGVLERMRNDLRREVAEILFNRNQKEVAEE